ncbi:hypothetical protein U1Q18_040425, partial [Sarracenia purpurea var. burkii]
VRRDVVDGCVRVEGRLLICQGDVLGGLFDKCRKWRRVVARVDVGMCGGLSQDW